MKKILVVLGSALVSVLASCSNPSDSSFLIPVVPVTPETPVQSGTEEVQQTLGPINKATDVDFGEDLSDYVKANPESKTGCSCNFVFISEGDWEWMIGDQTGKDLFYKRVQKVESDSRGITFLNYDTSSQSVRNYFKADYAYKCVLYVRKDWQETEQYKTKKLTGFSSAMNADSSEKNKLNYDLIIKLEPITVLEGNNYVSKWIPKTQEPVSTVCEKIKTIVNCVSSK